MTAMRAATITKGPLGGAGLSQLWLWHQSGFRDGRPDLGQPGGAIFAFDFGPGLAGRFLLARLVLGDAEAKLDELFDARLQRALLETLLHEFDRLGVVAGAHVGLAGDRKDFARRLCGRVLL